MKVSLKYPCSCRKEDSLPNGLRPEYFNTIDTAINKVLEHELDRDLYYVVHGEGKHILKVWAD